MKQILILAILYFTVFKTSAQYCDPGKFKKLEILSRKEIVTDSEFSVALKLVRNLERNKCSDYVKKRHGEEYVESSLTYLFGQICLKNKDTIAARAYVNYMKRRPGSAEEQICFSLEEIFDQQPGCVLSLIGFNRYMLTQLEWGFVNNHNNLTSKNYKVIFYNVNPELKIIYPKYKKAIDYLLLEIRDEVKGWEVNKKTS